MEENNQNKEPLNKDFKVPKLRFLRFKNDWQTAKLSDLFSVGMCKRIFSNQTSDTGEVPFYKIGTLGRIPDSYISKELFHEYKSKYRFPNIGETLISCSGTIGRCIKYDGKDAYFQDSNIVWLINDQRVILNDFLFYLIARYDWGFLNTTTIKRLFIKDLNNLTINYPQDQREQKHIVNLINTLSMKIRNIEDKINILKKYRKGIQKVAFRRTPNKAYVKLKSLVSFMPKSKLSAGNSIENGKYPFYLSGEKIGAINSFMYEGCYIIANDGGEAGFRLSNGPFAYSDHCICFQNANEWTTRNVYEYLDSQKNKITYVGFLGSGLKNIDRSYLQNFKIPLSIENKQLAIMFSLFDERIRHLENELLRLKATKRYLLANMFI